MLEIEVKYFVGGEAQARALAKRGGLAWQEGVSETNRIYDFDDRRLEAEGALVRLRTRPDSASLTFKRKTDIVHPGAKVREEHDTRIERPEAVEYLLRALGLDEVLRYERFRATYPVEGAVIEIDRLPGGWFCEIEGDPDAIARHAVACGLDRTVPIAWSYPAIFRHLGTRLGFEPRAWTFQFAETIGLVIPPPDDGWWKTGS